MKTKILSLVILGLFVFQTNKALSFNISKEALNDVIKENAPIVYLHSDDHYRPGNVDDYLQATDLYHGEKRLGKASEQNLKNLDKHYHLKITDSHIIRGNVEKSKTYVRVKHESGSLYVQYFFFYPYNGAGVFKLHTSIKSYNKIDLHPFGEHQGDWEHITVKLDDTNFNIQQIRIYQHGEGKSLTKEDMSFDDGHPIVYSSRHGHATYHEPGSNLTSHFVKHFKKCLNLGFKKVCKSVFTVRGGLRNDCDENGIRYDTSEYISLIAVEDISGIEISTPDWYYFAGKWGPKNETQCDDIIFDRIVSPIPSKKCVAKWCVKPRKGLKELIKSKIPEKAYGNGPTGPKGKKWWD